jgi:hypothetical protein
VQRRQDLFIPKGSAGPVVAQGDTELDGPALRAASAHQLGVQAFVAIAHEGLIGRPLVKGAVREPCF